MTCSEYITQNVQNSLKTVKNAADLEIAGTALSAADMAFDYLYPICPNYGGEPFPTAE